MLHQYVLPRYTCTTWQICCDMCLRLPTKLWEAIHGYPGPMRWAWFQCWLNYCDHGLRASCDQCCANMLWTSCHHPRMFLSSYPVHLEENTKSWTVQRYCEDEEKLFCGMIDGLAFLPENDVTDGMAYLPNSIPKGLGAPSAVLLWHVCIRCLPSDTATPTSPFTSNPELTMYVRVGIMPSPSWQDMLIQLSGGQLTVSERIKYRLRLHCYVSCMNHHSSVYGATQFSCRCLCTACRDGTKSIPDTLKGIWHCARGSSWIFECHIDIFSLINPKITILPKVGFSPSRVISIGILTSGVLSVYLW